MLHEILTYTDFNGEERSEDAYFNIGKAEAIRMEHSIEGGLSAKLEKIVKNKDENALINFFEDFIAKSYGIKSDDGRRIIKSEEITKAFRESPAYDALFMRLFTEEGYAAKFVQQIIPDVEEIKAKINK